MNGLNFRIIFVCVVLGKVDMYDAFRCSQVFPQCSEHCIVVSDIGCWYPISRHQTVGSQQGLTYPDCISHPSSVTSFVLVANVCGDVSTPSLPPRKPTNGETR